MGDGLRKASGRSRFDVLKRRGVVLAAAGLHGMGRWDDDGMVGWWRASCDEALAVWLLLLADWA